MKLVFTKTNLQDLLIYKPPIFHDNRGYFMESYNHKHFLEQNIATSFVQDNRSFSTFGTLRGLHLQVGAFAQSKLVTVISGHVYDVAVDLRPKSSTYKKWQGFDLKGEDGFSIYIPKGFAHGFVVLSETAEFFYKVDQYYDKQSERGILFSDAELNIDWKIPHSQLKLSDKDKTNPKLSTFLETYLKGII